MVINDWNKTVTGYLNVSYKYSFGQAVGKK
jgi:hypothetical protein